MTEVTIKNRLLRLQQVEDVPEISLYLSDTPPTSSPGQRYDCWAQTWVGGRALARYILDNPELVAGKTVVDLASGGGIVAIAAKLAGASRVVAIDDYSYSVQVMQLNAAANSVEIEPLQQNVFNYDPDYGDIFLIGDPFYDQGLFGYLEGKFRPILAGCPIRFDAWYHFYMTQDKIIQTYTLDSPVGYDDELQFETHVWWLSTAGTSE